GRLAYVTCSLLREENEAQVERFLEETPDFALVPTAHAWEEALGPSCPTAGSDYLRLTPAQHGTDGFFVALFERKTTAVIPGRSEGPDPELMNTGETVSC
ncbi:MAG TPA: hypothetical protein VM782_22475, partial [Stellaceae bacterium]|nr:hypothetical protein [Stellaceae bacterium]